MLSRFQRLAVLIVALGLAAYAQESPSAETKGLPPRATPADYQAHAEAGKVTIAAEFTGHSVATPDGIYSTEDYVMVEVGLFGPPDAAAKISIGDFSLRINGKKMPSPALPYGVVFPSLKDPEWEPTEASKKSKGGGISTGGGGNNDPPPTPPKMPIEMKRAMQQRVQKAALPEGDRMLPAAGLIFFQHGGKIKGIQTLELMYAGAAGKAALALQP